MAIGQDYILQLIESYSDNTELLEIPRVFIDYTNNDITLAIFLERLLYWTDKVGNSEGWFYRTHEDWAEGLCLSKSTVRRCINKLTGKEFSKNIKRPVIETKVKQVNGNPTTHYRVLVSDLLIDLMSFMKEGK